MSLQAVGPELDPATAQALEVARALAAAGVPVFLAFPALTDAGQWQPDGGHGGCGYWLPAAWEATEPDPSVIDRWRPGMATAAVMGHAVDGVDVDPRHGGDTSAAELADAGCWPMVVGRQATPSGGWHDLVNPLRVRSRDGVLPGIDVKAGLPDGTGRGFLWLAPTVKLSKVTGELASYRWEVRPMLDELDPRDASGLALAERIETMRRQGGPVAEHGADDAEPAPHTPFDQMRDAERANVEGYLDRLLLSVTGELTEAAAWTEGYRDDHDRGWQKLLADVCNRLGRLARAAWTPWTYEDARRELVTIVPGPMADAVGLEGTWNAQKHRRQPAAYPQSLDDDDWFRSPARSHISANVTENMAGGGERNSHAVAVTEVDEVPQSELIGHPTAIGEVAVGSHGSGGGRERGKPSQAQQLTQLARERYTFGVSTTGDPFAVPARGPMVAVTPRGGRSLRAELAAAYLRGTGKPPSQQALTNALTALEGIALATTPAARLALRVAKAGDQLVLDMGGDDGRVILIDRLGWTVSRPSPVLFRRTPLTGVLPTPEHGGDLAGLWDIINVAERDRGLLLADMVAAYFPDMPHPIMALTGEQGTGKSTATRVIVSLLDPSPVPLRKPPKDVETWAVAAGGSHVVAVDNVSTVPDWFSDSLCRASTGDGDVRRQLYTDGDLFVFAFKRVVILNGIDWGAVRGDLADRLIAVELERIPETVRARDDDLTQRWEATAPGILGGLLDLVAEVIRVLPTIQLHRSPRMADFAHIAAAVDDVTGYRSLDRYLELAGELAADAVTSDPVLAAITNLVVTEWEGPASVLLEQLDASRLGERPPRGWPATARALAQTLKRQSPALRRLGWTVDRTSRRTERGIVWRLSPPPTEPAAGADENLTERGNDSLARGSSALRQPPSTHPDLRTKARHPDSPDGMTTPPLLSLLSHERGGRNSEQGGRSKGAGDPPSFRHSVSPSAAEPVPLAAIIAELGGPCPTCRRVVCACHTRRKKTEHEEHDHD